MVPDRSSPGALAPRRRHRRYRRTHGRTARHHHGRQGENERNPALSSHASPASAGRLEEAGTGSRASENAAFTCLCCTAEVPACTGGGYRNHCPHCLWSSHVDELPGDRASHCGGPMEPVGLTRPRGKGWALVHLCVACGVRRVNRLAVDTVVPDDLDVGLQLPPA
ncbi:MAG TPA: RNHCP domain-containing protein [Actinopolymorphaceae bacterium]|nr:RNHCP domain-containing protein [Actinopolymorphaceae bacterium]